MTSFTNLTEREKITFKVWNVLGKINDPEIPVISVVDLGMINDVVAEEVDSVIIKMTPTFAGCPAIKYLQMQIAEEIRASIPELKNVKVEIDFSESWTSDRITEKGLKALKEFGLATPGKAKACISADLFKNVQCPFCSSTNTTFKSPFGGTLCRAVHYCNNCKQAFEQFKPI
jgi:ring-1,2-phenylacetyl-CoA epoxidase subunit PaaD